MSLSYSYQVFSVDPVVLAQEREIDGEMVAVLHRVVSVQLTSDDHGTINLRVAHPQTADHPFVAGERVTVTFEQEVSS